MSEQRQTEMYLSGPEAADGMVKVRTRADGVICMGEHPEPCPNEPYCHYDRAIFATCPCCKAIAQSFVREQEEQLHAALVRATNDGPWH